MFFRATLLAAAMASSAYAVIITSVTGDPAPGGTITINWQEQQGPVSLTLRSGNADALDTGVEITSGATGNSFQYKIPSDATFQKGTLAIEINDGTSNNFFAVGDSVGNATTPPTDDEKPTSKISPTSPSSPIDEELDVTASASEEEDEEMPSPTKNTTSSTQILESDVDLPEDSAPGLQVAFSACFAVAAAAFFL